MPSGMAPHVVWEIVEGQSAQRGDRTQLGKG